MHSSQIGGLNDSKIRNKELYALLEKHRVAIDREERKKILVDIQKIAVDQAYWIPLFTGKQYYIVNNRVQEAELYSLHGLALQDSWVNN